MATETGNKTNLALQIDKISYGAAAVVALAVLFFAMYSAKDLPSLSADLEQKKVDLATKIAGQSGPDPGGIPNFKVDLDKQWAVATVDGPWISPWSVEVRPALVRLTDTTGPVQATHEAGRIARITYLRDAKKHQVYLKVEAEAGQNVNLT